MSQLVHAWGPEEVTEWLLVNDLGQYLDCFADMDGTNFICNVLGRKEIRNKKYDSLDDKSLRKQPSSLTSGILRQERS
jgi:hypothetical protein